MAAVWRFNFCGPMSRKRNKHGLEWSMRGSGRRAFGDFASLREICVCWPAVRVEVLAVPALPGQGGMSRMDYAWGIEGGFPSDVRLTLG